MKKQVILLALGLGLSLMPVALSATTIEQAYIELHAGRPEMPVPVSIVTPRVSSEFVGWDVEIEFTVDAKGRVSGARPAAPRVPVELARPLMNAIEQWQFAPATGPGGEPLTTKVRLPVSIVP